MPECTREGVCPVTPASQLVLRQAPSITEATYTLNGTVVDEDRRPNDPPQILWEVVAGPTGGTAAFDNPYCEDPTVTFYGATGQYTLQLSATDGECDSEGEPIWIRSLVRMTTGAAATAFNEELRVHAGADHDLNANPTPENPVTDTHSFADAWVKSQDGAVTYTDNDVDVIWQIARGPAGGALFTDASVINATVTFTLPGTYVFRMRVTHPASGNTGSDEVCIKVLFPVEVEAGAYDAIRLPAVLHLDQAVVTYNGQSDPEEWPDGADLSFTWSMVSGPGPVYFDPPLDLSASEYDLTRSGILDPIARFSRGGTYILTLTASLGSLRVADSAAIAAEANQIISAGSYHTLAIRSGGNVLSVGRNNEMQLGIGWGFGQPDESVFLPVHNGEQSILGSASTQLTNIICADAADTFNLAVDGRGKVWWWGNMTLTDGYTLGGEPRKVYEDPSTDKQLSEVAAVSGSKASWLDVGNYEFALAMSRDGHVWSWGSDYAVDKLGRSTSDPEVPGKVRTDVGDPLSVLQGLGGVCAGTSFSMAREGIGGSYTGRVYTWGENGSWLGNNSESTSGEAVLVHAGEQGTGHLENIIDVAAGDAHALAVDADGYVWSWGDSDPPLHHSYWESNGALNCLGVGDCDDRNEPAQVLVSTNPDVALMGITAVSAGARHSMALDEDGHVWVWGSNELGQLGIGDTDVVKSPVAVQVCGPDTDGDGTPDPLSDIVSIDAGAWNCFAVERTGAVWTWGHNGSGQLSIGSLSESRVLSPVRVIWSRQRVFNAGTSERWFNSIQAAIDDDETMDGQTIIVYPGEYYEHIDFDGKKVLITSVDPDDPEIVASTIINGGGSGDVVTFSSYYDYGVSEYLYVPGTLKGITVLNGDVGIRVNAPGTYTSGDPEPQIDRCHIRNNDIGVYCGGFGVRMHLRRSRIEGNRQVGFWPSGQGSQIEVVSCLFSQNGREAYTEVGPPEGFQGGIVSYDPSPGLGSCVVQNCTIIDNGSFDTGQGCGIQLYSGSGVNVENSIVWGNAAEQIMGVNVTVSYSCVEGGWSGATNIESDPQLVVGSYVLQPGSPCIDAGDPGWTPEPDQTDIIGNPRLANGTVDIGAHYCPAISRITTIGYVNRSLKSCTYPQKTGF